MVTQAHMVVLGFATVELRVNAFGKASGRQNLPEVGNS